MRKSARLDRILLRRGWVDDAQVALGLQEQQRSGLRWGSALVQLGIISEAQLTEALAEQYRTPQWDPTGVNPDEATLQLFRDNWLRDKWVFPVMSDPKQRTFTVAMADPWNVVLTDEICFHTNCRELTILAAAQVTLLRLWERFYPQTVPDSGGGAQPAASAARPIDRCLDLDFGFATRAGKTAAETESASRPVAHILLWLTQPFVAKLLRSLLETERCEVGYWDGRTTPDEEWGCLVYDDDHALGHPEALQRLRQERPRLQLITRPSWITALLRSPLSYERLRDGYLHMARRARQWLDPCRASDGSTGAHYLLAMARTLSLSSFEIDTLLAACELIPLATAKTESLAHAEMLVQELGCPYPVLELMQSATRRFDELGVPSGRSTPQAPMAARLYAVVSAFLDARAQHPVTTIKDAGELAESLRQEAGRRFDPLAVEALLRVVREEVLEGCLPPGPYEVMLIADRPVQWHHLPLLLENEGWRVVTAGGSAEARMLIERRRPHAVVWAAAGAIEWIRWQAGHAPGIATFLILDEFDSALARAALEAGYEDIWSGAWDTGVAAAKLRRAVQKRPNLPTRAESVTGTLRQLGFIDLVQILAAGGRSVRIDLSHSGVTATVILWQGQIKYAEAGTKSGEEAIHEIITWDDATFSFSAVDTPPVANCRLPNEAILLEGCRLIDEQSRDAITHPVLRSCATGL